MFLWPVVLLVCEVAAEGMHNDSPYHVAAYIVSPLFYAAILIVIALCEYPASRRFLKWLAGIILVIAALWSGVTYYVPFLRHGWKWWNGTIKSPIFWLYVALVFLSIIYLAMPQRAWIWLGDRVRLLWKRVGHGRSI